MAKTIQIERVRVWDRTTAYAVTVPAWNPLANCEESVVFEVKVTDVSLEFPTLKTSTRCVRGIPGVGIDSLARERARRFAKKHHTTNKRTRP